LGWLFCFWSISRQPAGPKRTPKLRKFVDDERTFSQGVLDDFNELQEAVITHLDIDKIKALLTTNQEGL